MKARDREERLVHLLVRQQGFVTVAEIAEELEISAKTLYRMVKKLNDEGESQLIEAEKGKGIRLNYEAYLASPFNSKKKQEKKSVYYNFSPVERRLHVVKELLFQAPLSLREDHLFSRYYLSPSAIYTDQDSISKLLGKHGLKLQKSDGRLMISGPEKNIRTLLIEIMAKLNLINFEDLSNISVGFNKAALRFVINQLEFIEKEIDSLIPAPYNINLMTHLYVLLERAGKGGVDRAAQVNEAQLKHDRYYAIAAKVAANMEGYLCRQLPLSETANICAYLNGSRVERGEEDPAPYTVSDEVMEITDFYVKMFFEAMDINTAGTAGDLPGLASHIKPLLNRLRTGLTVKNPLLEDICQEYGDTFEIVREISQQASARFNLPEIDDDENGFITLYFARYLEQNPHKVRTLIICTTGLGTSELLKTKVARFFPEMEVIGTAATGSITKERIQAEQVDMILTTVGLTQDWGVPVVLVNTLFIDRDKQNVRKALKALQGDG